VNRDDKEMYLLLAGIAVALALTVALVLVFIVP
jgi:hypothetical protein